MKINGRREINGFFRNNYKFIFRIIIYIKYYIRFNEQ